MTDDALTRVEAMLVALRDQVDRLSERLETQLERHERLLVRLQGAVGEATWALREDLLEVHGAAGCARCDPAPRSRTPVTLEG